MSKRMWFEDGPAITFDGEYEPVSFDDDDFLLDDNVQEKFIDCSPIDDEFSNFESALAMVGLLRIGGVKREPNFFPHRGQFEIFIGNDFIFNGEIVIKIDLPSIGYESLNGEIANNLSIGNRGQHVYGNSHNANVVGGIRPVIPGILVVQFLVYTATRKYVVLYDYDRVRLLDCGGPATYKYDAFGRYNLLGGEPSVDLRWDIHPFCQMSTNAVPDKSVPVELNINGMSYVIMPDRVANIQVDDINATTFHGEVKLGMHSYLVTKDGLLHRGSYRPDRVIMDNESLSGFIKLPLVADVLSLCSDEERKPIEVNYKIPVSETIIDYVKERASIDNLGPREWTVSRGPKYINELLDKARLDLIEVITPNCLTKLANQVGSFLLKSKLTKVGLYSPLIQYSTPTKMYSSHPFRGVKQKTLIIDVNKNPSIRNHYDRAIRCSSQGKYVILYVALRQQMQLPSLSNYTNPVSLPPRFLNELIESLSDRSQCGAQLAIAFNLPLRLLLLYMDRRRDLFVPRLYNDRVYWRLRVWYRGPRRSAFVKFKVKPKVVVL